MTSPRELLDDHAQGKATLKIVVAQEDLAPKAFAALRAVLDLHQPQVVDMGERQACQGCSSWGPGSYSYIKYHVDWPCPTVRAITTALEDQ